MNDSSGTETGEGIRRAGADSGPVARPWRLPGWKDRTVAALDTQLASAGLRRTGPAEVVKRWTLSVVLRCATSGGVVFHKRSHPSLAHEGRVLAALGARDPVRVPAVVAQGAPYDGWCTREVRLSPGTDFPQDARGRALAVLSGLQRDWLGRPAELAALGCWSRTPRALADMVPTAARHDLFGPASPLPGALSAREWKRFSEACARLPELCAELAAAPPGVTLVHGDLHPGNWGIARDTGRIVLLDWAEASVGHPFLDIAAALRSCSDAGAHARALDRYFTHWAPLMSREECRAVWRLAEPVAAFNQLVTYTRLLDEAEPHERADWAPRLLWWARRVPRTVRRARHR
ncbi:phosphotransferase [Streptomyces sp. NPDC001185]|uniref:phosphotransferase family protein n=1 Tax=Streptomyces sp. NPDC001185 TaxID=3154380 RepID=UPI0033318A9B